MSGAGAGAAAGASDELRFAWRLGNSPTQHIHPINGLMKMNELCNATTPSSREYRE